LTVHLGALLAVLDGGFSRLIHCRQSVQHSSLGGELGSVSERWATALHATASRSTAGRGVIDAAARWPVRLRGLSIRPAVGSAFPTSTSLFLPSERKGSGVADGDPSPVS